MILIVLRIILLTISVHRLDQEEIQWLESFHWLEKVSARTFSVAALELEAGGFTGRSRIQIDNVVSEDTLFTRFVAPRSTVAIEPSLRSLFRFVHRVAACF